MAEPVLWADVPDEERGSPERLTHFRGWDDPRWREAHVRVFTEPACPYSTRIGGWRFPCAGTAVPGEPCGGHVSRRWPTASLPAQVQAVRVRQALRLAGFVEAWQLFGVSDDELLGVRGIGAGALRLIRELDAQGRLAELFDPGRVTPPPAWTVIA